MYSPFAFEHLVHPETDSEGRIKHPFKVAVSNTVAVFVPVGIACVVYLLQYEQLSNEIAWGWLAMIPLFIIAVTFGHAFLGARIGGRLSNRIFGAVLLILMVAGVLWLVNGPFANG